MFTRERLKEFIITCGDNQIQKSKIEELTDYLMEHQTEMYNSKDKLDKAKGYTMTEEEFKTFAENAFMFHVMNFISKLRRN